MSDISSGLGTVPAAFIGSVQADATANINIKENTRIEGNKVSITANANTQAKITPLSILLPVAFGYAESNPTANVKIADGAFIKTTDDLILSAVSDSEVDVSSIAISISSLPALTRSLFVGTVFSCFTILRGDR
ncbi:hypothetical protein WH8501_06310 [Crocosphaera watsonii WH 8501]|uniref:Uncharacterized protein n=1 Tax=Crocosphaera watsonii WH 8501 TaxID=165597 RepID=Q4C3I0_CROWT|nr:hypothetical protein [Crocosphaera watsonii]EAM50727.1 hypothetical protein CwatDRAFT_3642 [Crocosphaera watsonii WH 8501]